MFAQLLLSIIEKDTTHHYTMVRTKKLINRKLTDILPSGQPKISFHERQNVMKCIRDSADWARTRNPCHGRQKVQITPLPRRMAVGVYTPLTEEDTNRLQELAESGESGGNFAVEVNMREHYKPTAHDLAMDAMPTKIAIPVGEVELCHAYTGRQICTCMISEVMTHWQRRNCMITVAAAALNVPRLSVTLVVYTNEVAGTTKALVVINMLTNFLESGEPNYDPVFDCNAPEGEARLPIHGYGYFPCLVCGDIAEDADSDRHSSDARMQLCIMCSPCAVCKACRTTINGVPVCFACIDDKSKEYRLLSSRQRRRYNIHFRSRAKLTPCGYIQEPLELEPECVSSSDDGESTEAA